MPSETIHINKINGDMITLNIDSEDSIMNIKAALQDKIGIPSNNIVLIFNGEILKSDTILSEVRDSYPDNPLDLEIRLRNYTKGGGKYKKRKTKKRKKKSRRKSKKRKSRR
jgi:hypothetical protein